MSRNRRRASRALIGILVVVLVLGMIIHLSKKKSATETTVAVNVAEKPADPAPVVEKPADPLPPETLVTTTPTAMAIDKVDTRPAATPAVTKVENAAPVVTVAKVEAPAVEAAPAAPPTWSGLLSGQERLGGAKANVVTAGSATQPSPMLAAVTPGMSAAQPLESFDSPLAASKAKSDNGQLLAARKILVDALINNTLSPADTIAAKKSLDDLNATIVFSRQKFSNDEFGGTFNVPPGALLAKIANSHDVTADALMRINGITDARKLRAGQTIKVLKGPFNAVVYKTAFRLELWQGEPYAKGSMYVTSFAVGLGKDDSTPTGVWAVQNKLKDPAYYSPRGEGVISSSDPKNPLGEYWIGLTGVDGHAVGKTSYGIHGTIEPETIGKQESMGCIRLRNEDVEVVYELLVEGKSTVTVKE